MNLKDMKCFIVICDKKSITAAAEFLYVSPQALSKTIKKMEIELGAELLKRSKNGVETTIYGKIFYDDAEEIVRDYEGISSKIENLTLQNKGILRMASAFGILRYLTPEFINSFTDTYSDIHLEYMEFPDKYVVDNIQEGNYDVGLIPYITKEPELEYIDLFSSELYFITHEGSRFYDYKEISVVDIIKEPLIIENMNFVIHHILLEACNNERVEPNIYFNTSGFSLCYKLCHKGEGNTISMPFIYEDMKYGNLRMIPIKEHLKWKVAMIYRKNIVISNNFQKIVKHSQDWCH